MSTALRREDPSLLDSLIGHGAEATQRCIPTRKRYAAAVGVSRQRASRHRLGDEYSPATKFLVQLARSGSPWPMLATGITTVLQVTMKLMSEDQLFARLYQLDELEHTAEAEENRLTVRVAVNPTMEMLEAAANANVVEGEICFERVALLRELARRKRAP